MLIVIECCAKREVPFFCLVSARLDDSGLDARDASGLKAHVDSGGGVGDQGVDGGHGRVHSRMSSGFFVKSIFALARAFIRRSSRILFQSTTISSAFAASVHHCRTHALNGRPRLTYA